MDVIEHSPLFKARRQSRAMNGLHGFDVVDVVDNQQWQARIVLNSRKALSRLHDHIAQRKVIILQEWADSVRKLVHE